jgi:hypothetical protein
MDKAYLTASPAIVNVLDGVSVGWLWTCRCPRDFAVYFRQARCKTAHHVQSPGINNVDKMLPKTKGECQYGISFY